MNNNQQNTSLNETSLEKVTRKVNDITNFINNITHKIGYVLLFGLMLVTVVDVLMRFLFNSPIKGTMELTEIVVAMVVFFSLGMGQIMGNHLEIDFLVNKFPIKVQRVVQIIIYLIGTLLLVLLTWKLFELGVSSMNSGEVKGDLGLPVYIVIFLVTIGSIGFTLTYLAALLTTVTKVVVNK